MKSIWIIPIIAVSLIFATQGEAFGAIILDDIQTLAVGSEVRIAASENNVYVLYSEWFSNDILLRASSDFGATFGPVRTVSVGDGFSSQRIAASGDNVYVLFQDHVPSGFGSSTFGFLVSHDNGVNFETQQDFGPYDLENAFGGIHLLASGNNVYALWGNNTVGVEDNPFFKTSSDSGDNFASTIAIGPPGESNVDADIAVFGNTIIVVYEESTFPDDGLILRASVNNGAVFVQTVNLDATDNQTTQPFVVITKNNIAHIIWRSIGGGNPGEVLYTSGTGGGGFALPIIATAAEAASSSPEVLLASEECVYVVYRTSGVLNMKWVVKCGFGAFSAPQTLLSNDDFLNFFKDENTAALVEETVFIVAEPSSSSDVFMFMIENSGTSSSSVNLSQSEDRSIDARIATSSNFIYVAWWDDSAPGQVKFIRSAFNIVPCSLPTPGLDYVISSSCTLSSTVSVDKNVIVEMNAVLTILNGVTLNIDFSQSSITIESGSGVLIKAGGKIT